MELNCNFCTMTFKGEVAIKSHLQRVHFYCQRCDRKCESMPEFLKHCKEDHIFKEKCDKCNMKFLSKEELESHDKSVHPVLKCGNCEYVGKTKEAIRKHSLIHSKDRVKSQCVVCKREFADESGLKRHMEIQHLESTIVIKCEFCSYTTKAKDSMNRHVKICGENVEMFHCDSDSCSYKVPTTGLLRNHNSQVHNGAKRCEFCSYESKHAISMNRHQGICGPAVTMVTCDTCPSKYPTETLLASHRARNHQNLKLGGKCKFCSYETKDRSTMERHLEYCGPNVKLFECSKCPYKVSNERVLNFHKIKIHKLKFHECEHCSYKSADSGRMKAHEQVCGPDVSLLQCKKCDYEVPTERLLQFHVDKAHNESSYTKRQKAILEETDAEVGEFKCEKCDHVEKYERLLQFHFDKTHGEKRKCPFCDFESKFKHRIESHLDKCGPEATFHQCEMCEYKCSDKSVFGSHMKHKHNVSKATANFKCLECAFQATSKHKLDRHTIVIHGEKLNCQFCSYSSIEKNLAHHQKICGPEKEMFVCEVENCHFKVPTPILFKRHICETHPETPLKQCDKCKYQALAVSLLKYHSDQVHAVLLKCDFCDFQSKIKSEIDDHTAKCGPDVEMYVCEKCNNYKNSCKDIFESHTCKDPEEGRKKCEFCDYTTRHPKSMRRHVEKCGNDVTMFKCSDCSFKVSSEFSLSLHNSRTHGKTVKVHGRKPIKNCQFCDYKVSRNGNQRLQKHNEICGPDTKKYLCDICQLKSGTIFYLAWHSKHVHGKKLSKKFKSKPQHLKKSSKCEYCDHEAKGPQALKKHNEVCGPDTKKYLCDICQFKSGTMIMISIHMEKKHGKKFSRKCKYCDYEAKGPQALKKHNEACTQESKKHQCDQCQYKAGTPLGLTMHIDKIHGKKTKCDFCDFSSDSPYQLRKHEENCFISDEKFICDLCQKEFVSLNVMKSHRRTHTNPKKRKAEDELSEDTKPKTKIRITGKKLKEQKQKIIDSLNETTDPMDFDTTFEDGKKEQIETKMEVEDPEISDFKAKTLPKLDQEIPDFNANTPSELKKETLKIEPKIKSEDNTCDQCDFVAKSEIGLKAHLTINHIESGSGQWVVKLKTLQILSK